jgi:polar amino acid transport system substrate-binding protein
LFITARTKEREKSFKWVGPVFTDKTEVFSLRNRNITINSVEDLKKYSIASYIGDYQEEIIKKLGIPEENLDRVTSSEARLKKVYSGRTDLIFINKGTLIDYANREEINPYVFQSVYKLEGIDMCYAFSFDTPDCIIEKMQQILDELHKEGFVKNIFKKYGFEEAYYIENKEKP